MTKADMVCIFCNGKFVIENIELFIEKLSEASEVLKAKLKLTNESEINKLLAANNIIDIKKELDTKGHIRMACTACHLKTSWEAMPQL